MRTTSIATMLLLVGCGVPDGAPTVDGGTDGASETPNIVGGTPDDIGAFTQVVQVDEGCSGTFISSGRVLTAGHCVCPAAPLSTVRGTRYVMQASACRSRAAVTIVGTAAPVSLSTTVLVHPDFYIRLRADGERFVIDEDWIPGRPPVVSDVAVLDLIVAPALASMPPLVPIPHAATPPVVGQIATVVGFGHTACDSTDLGTRVYGVNRIRDVNVSSIRIEADTGGLGALTAPGDSGGPLLVNLSGRSSVAGITSTGRCGTDSTFTNVAAYDAWIRSTCPGCTITVASPMAGASFSSGSRIMSRWTMSGFGNQLRMVARRGGTELVPPISTTLSPLVGTVAIDLLPEWGTGTDFELCLASEVPDVSACVPFAITPPSTACPSGTMLCAGECTDTQSSPANCGGCGRTCSGACAEGVCASSMTGPNLIVNGGFESATDVLFPPSASWMDGGWSTYFYDASASYGTCARVTSDSAEGSAHSACEINAGPWAASWHFLLSQAGLRIEDARRYRLSFAARSSVPRLLTATVQQNLGPDRHADRDLIFSLAPTWTRFTLEFTGVVAGGVDPDSKLAFWLLDPATVSSFVIEIDDVALTPL